MLKKIIFFNLLFSTFIIQIAKSAESGGMPQLNPEFWISQIFWLIISFGILFIVLSKFILPKIRNNIELRKSEILDNIETAEKRQLIGEEVNNSSISAIVDDLYKKNKGKYYGN